LQQFRQIAVSALVTLLTAWILGRYHPGQRNGVDSPHVEVPDVTTTTSVP